MALKLQHGRCQSAGADRMRPRLSQSSSVHARWSLCKLRRHWKTIIHVYTRWTSPKQSDMERYAVRSYERANFVFVPACHHLHCWTQFLISEASEDLPAFNNDAEAAESHCISELSQRPYRRTGLDDNNKWFYFGKWFSEENICRVSTYVKVHRLAASVSLLHAEIF